MSATETLRDPKGTLAVSTMTADRCRTSQQPAQMCRRVGKLVLLIVAPVQGDKDSEIVRAWCHPDTRSREFCAYLVVSTC